MILEKVGGCHFHSKAKINCWAGSINPVWAAQVSELPASSGNTEILANKYKTYHHPKPCSYSAKKLFHAFAQIMLASYATQAAFI